MPSQYPILRSRVFALAILVASATPAVAQQWPHRLEQLAAGVYALRWQIPPDGVADSNVLIIINDEDVVVVDTGILPSSAATVVADIRELTPLPVRYVVNTHFHSDHHYGNAVYRTAYPGVDFVQHPATRELVINEDVPSLARNLEVEYPAVVERLRAALATGRRSSGEEIDDKERESFAASLALYQRFLREMAPTPLVPGTITVADRLVLHRGDRTIEIRHLGRGNTPGDLVVYLPKEKIVATGDLVVLPIPYAFGSFLGDWPDTLRALRQLDATTIVPGHGEIQRDWSYVDRLIPLFESSWSQVEAGVAAGKDQDAIRAAIDLEIFLPFFGGESARESFRYLFLQPAVAATYEKLTAAVDGEP